MTQDTMERQREATPEEGARWQAQYGEGYRVARGDIQWNQPPRIPLIEIPRELYPGECGTYYVARHVGQAFQIGYAAAWRFELGKAGQR